MLKEALQAYLCQRLCPDRVRSHAGAVAVSGYGGPVPEALGMDARDR